MELQHGNVQAALATAQQEPTGEWQDVAPDLARRIGVAAVPPEGLSPEQGSQTIKS